MSFCNKCGNKIVKNEVCVNCNQSMNQKDDNIDIIEKKLKKSKVLACISFILALTPILLFVGSALMAEIGSFSGLFIYIYYAFSFPIIIISLVCGIISYRIKNNNLAFIGILIDSIPFAFVAAFIVIYTITVILGLN